MNSPDCSESRTTSICTNREQALEKKRARDKEYRERNRDKIKAHREANREAQAERMRKWRQANKEHRAEYAKRYREGNEQYRAKKRVADKAYYDNVRKKDPDVIRKEKERGKAWRAANPDKNREKSARYRSRHRELVAERARDAYWRKTPEERKAIAASRSEYFRQWREAHIDELREYGKQYYANNLGRIDEANRAYYLAHRAERLEKQRQYYEAHRESCLEYSREWAALHPEQRRVYNRRYWEGLTPEQKRAAIRRRYWQLRSTEEGRAYLRHYRQKFYAEARECPEWREQQNQKRQEWYRRNLATRRIIARVRAHQRRVKLQGKGKYTPQDVEELYRLQKGRCAGCGKCLKNGYEVDHVMPANLNGSNTKENLQLLCVRCNRSKGHKHPDVWAAQIGRLFV